MIKGTRNQLHNVGNPHQGHDRKVVVVCSAGLLRSPTLANKLHNEFRYNTRTVGACKSFALIPISQALIWWADEIVFVDAEAYLELDQEEKDEIEAVGVKKIILNIPDEFEYGDSWLERIGLTQYMEKISERN